MSEASFVTVATFMNTFEAELARNDLESAGLHAFLLGQGIAAIDWIRISTIGGIRLQVPSDEAEQANAILEDARSAERARKQHAKTASANFDEDEPRATYREENAYRALRSACLGLLFLLLVPIVSTFLQAYALWLVIKVRRSDQRLSPGARRCAVIAGVAGGASLLFLAVVLLNQLWQTLRF
jgi:hypothetical protein